MLHCRRGSFETPLRRDRSALISDLRQCHNLVSKCWQASLDKTTMTIDEQVFERQSIAAGTFCFTLEQAKLLFKLLLPDIPFDFKRSVLSIITQVAAQVDAQCIPQMPVFLMETLTSAPSLLKKACIFHHQVMNGHGSCSARTDMDDQLRALAGQRYVAGTGPILHALLATSLASGPKMKGMSKKARIRANRPRPISTEPLNPKP